jgi:ABC-2 type transport system ATP-binding protein
MIEVKELIKCFGQKVAVDNVSFTVQNGEVLGFLGPNAAGKSTTMRIITGFLPPTSGTAVVGGDDIITKSLSARKRIGYLPENAPVYPDMSVVGFLDFIAEIRGFSGREKAKRVENTLERCFLSEVRYQTISTLSKGFKQRVCFAQSILHEPQYLLMDEPTDGLDPNQKHEVRAMIREMAKEKTIILSTHNLEEVDAVCTRVIIIAGGRIVADDTPERLKARSALHGALRFTMKGLAEEDLVREVVGISGVGRVEVLSRAESEISLRVYPSNAGVLSANRIARRFQEKEWSVESFFMEEGRLDEVFRTITASASEPDSVPR